MTYIFSLVLLVLGLFACNKETNKTEIKGEPLPPVSSVEEKVTAPRKVESPRTLLVGGTILDGKGGKIEKGYVAFENGYITDVAAGNPQTTDDAQVIELNGRFVTDPLSQSQDSHKLDGRPNRVKKIERSPNKPKTPVEDH